MLIIIVGDIVLLLIYYTSNWALNKAIEAYKSYKLRKEEKFKQFMVERKQTRLVYRR